MLLHPGKELTLGLSQEKRLSRMKSEWAAPSFIIPKQDDTVRFINDFRELLRFVFIVIFIKEIRNKSKML